MWSGESFFAAYLVSVVFKSCVSRHEHLYEAIEKHLIRSDDFIADQVVAERFIGGSTVILCTVSMLSNPGLGSCRIYDLVPVERLIVDEASQIDSFEFMVSFFSSCLFCLTRLMMRRRI